MVRTKRRARGKGHLYSDLGGTAATWPLAARAQQPERMRRIGVLMHTGADEPEAQACFAAFMQGLQEIWLGRWAQYADRLSLERGDAARLRKHATELVALGPEVPCATGCPPY
jgi:putative ABC transport system substrate-binding protein